MSLQQQFSGPGLRLRWVQRDALGIGDSAVSHSVVVTDSNWQPWPVARFDEIDEAALDQLLALEPELILLGSGAQQRFLPPRLQARLLARGVGIECMDNAAAARTFNLLADEGRSVIAALLIESDAA